MASAVLHEKVRSTHLLFLGYLALEQPGRGLAGASIALHGSLYAKRVRRVHADHLVHFLVALGFEEKRRFVKNERGPVRKGFVSQRKRSFLDARMGYGLKL